MYHYHLLDTDISLKLVRISTSSLLECKLRFNVSISYAAYVRKYMIKFSSNR